MWKWIKRLDTFVRFMAAVARVIVAILNALDPDNNHENGVEPEIKNRHNKKELPK